MMPGLFYLKFAREGGGGFDFFSLHLAVPKTPRVWLPPYLGLN